MPADVTKARRLVDKKDEYYRLKQEAEAAEREYRELEADFWMDMEEGEDTTFTKDLGEGYGKVQFQRRETIKGRVIDPEEAEAALSELGIDEAILAPHRQVRGKVLNEHVRSLLKSGKPLPRGVDFTARRFVTVTKKGS